MNCNSAMEKLAECARRRIEPELALEAHLKSCHSCTEAWEAERNLTDHLRVIRIAASGRRSPAATRDALLRQFTEKHRAAANRRWLGSLAAAAAVLLALWLLQGVARRPQPERAGRSVTAQADLRKEADAQADAQTQGDSRQSPDAAQSQDAAQFPGDAQYAGFIPVPYVPPLATGELVSVVHTELYPAALANLGVSVDPVWATELPADLLVGEDGFPRAVRVSADYSDERGF